MQPTEQNSIVGQQESQMVERVDAPNPEGYVDRRGACEMFGIGIDVWKRWMSAGYTPPGHIVFIPGQRKGKAMRKLYAIEDLEKMREKMSSTDKVCKNPLNPKTFLIPQGYVDRAGACRMFGISKTRWDRWTWTGRITCGVQQSNSMPTIYPIDELEKLIAELGKLCPPYPDPLRPGVYRVPVHGWAMKRKEVLIDEESLPLLEGGRLQCPGMRNAKVPRDLQYVVFYKDGVVKELFHRMVLGITDPEAMITHLNRDPLDCRKVNLLIRTKSEMMQNARKIQMRMGKPTSSQYKGVSWDEKKGKWAARIRAEGRTRHLGRFNDELAAAEAYDEAARKYYGEFAYQNFPNGIDARLEEDRLAA